QLGSAIGCRGLALLRLTTSLIRIGIFHRRACHDHTAMARLRQLLIDISQRFHVDGVPGLEIEITTSIINGVAGMMEPEVWPQASDTASDSLLILKIEDLP